MPLALGWLGRCLPGHLGYGSALLVLAGWAWPAVGLVRPSAPLGLVGRGAW